MNTTSKGDKLEQKIYNYFKKQIDENAFPYHKKYCKIYMQKGYYSKDREKNIKFDISIETYLPGQATYSNLTLIECKNYNHRVPVDDVEEFFAKIQQISPANTKGILASSNSFQEGSFRFSKSKGIGLLRFYSPSELNWELTRSPSSMISNSHAINERHTAKLGLLFENYKSNYFDCYCYVNGEYTNSIDTFISTLTSINLSNNERASLKTIRNRTKPKRLTVKPISQNQITEICQKIYHEIDYNNGEVPLPSICNWLSREHNLKIITEEHPNSNILGKINFNPFTIYLNDSESNNPGRKRFTLAHEIGHFLLGHHAYMASETCSISDINVEKPNSILISDIMKMEEQANQFASCLLLPHQPLRALFFSDLAELKIQNKGHGHLFLDRQPCNLNNYYIITNRIMNKFKVSRTVAKIRLIRLGLLNETHSSINPQHTVKNSHTFTKLLAQL